MSYPRITIITPSYNQGHYIEQTICSVLEQAYPNLEYFIIDGGSKDNTVEIIRKYEKHLAGWVSEKDKGQSDAIIKGMKKATGDIVNWLNSDDYYEPGALKKVAGAFEDPSINVFCGISRVFGENKEYYSAGTDIYPGNLAKTIGWARIDQPETFFRRSAWEKIGGIDRQFHFLMDREFWIRYLLTFGLDGVRKENELLVHFRLHPGSKTVSQQSGFVQEGLDYFYSLAIDKGLEAESGIIAGYRPCRKLDLLPTGNSISIRSVMHNFFWCRAADAYALNDWERFDYFASHTDPAELAQDDRKKLQQLRFRRRVFPSLVKKWWNQIRSK